MTALALLNSVAAEFGVEGLIETHNHFTFVLPVTLPSEEQIAFRLEARPGAAGHVTVREVPPQRLPRCCPERHINQDGSFCMNWQEGDPRPVRDEISARAWWALLSDFLRRQITVSKLRRWVGPARAHGIAARFQDRAEQFAARLGEPVASQVARGSLVTRLDQRRGRNRIELSINNAVLNRINLPARTLANTAVPCPCPAGRTRREPIKDCETHAQDLAELIDAVHRWRKAEAEYLLALRAKGVRCCGTLDHCPLQ